MWQPDVSLLLLYHLWLPTASKIKSGYWRPSPPQPHRASSHFPNTRTLQELLTALAHSVLSAYPSPAQVAPPPWEGPRFQGPVSTSLPAHQLHCPVTFFRASLLSGWLAPESRPLTNFVCLCGDCPAPGITMGDGQNSLKNTDISDFICITTFYVDNSIGSYYPYFNEGVTESQLKRPPKVKW